MGILSTIGRDLTGNEPVKSPWAGGPAQERHASAKAAVQKGWDGLRKAKYIDKDAKPKKGVWDESRVMDYSDLKRVVNKAGPTIRSGRVVDICVEKGHALPKGHFDRTK